MATIGNNLIGSQQTNLRLDFRIFAKVTLPDTNGGVIDNVEVYTQGNGAAGSGTGRFKGVVYRDVGAVPTTLLGTGAEVSAAFGVAAAWRMSTIASPAAIPAGDTAVWIGHHGGATDSVLAYNRNTSGGSGGFVGDTYADGPANPSGAITTDANQVSLRANWTGLPVNSVAPVASGTGTVGQTLSVTDGTWTYSPSFTYQWKRGGVNIGGATSNTYLLDALDAGTTVTCAVTGTNIAGNASGTSNGIAVAASGSGAGRNITMMGVG